MHVTLGDAFDISGTPATRLPSKASGASLDFVGAGL